MLLNVLCGHTVAMCCHMVQAVLVRGVLDAGAFARKQGGPRPLRRVGSVPELLRRRPGPHEGTSSTQQPLLAFSPVSFSFGHFEMHISFLF